MKLFSARWIDMYSDLKDNMLHSYMCSNCGVSYYFYPTQFSDWQFCPHCGRRMKGEYNEQ